MDREGHDFQSCRQSRHNPSGFSRWGPHFASPGQARCQAEAGVDGDQDRPAHAGAGRVSGGVERGNV